jgi:hypothetical protein
MQRDVVVDTVTKEDFQDINDKDGRCSQYPPIHDNKDNQAE